MLVLASGSPRRQQLLQEFKVKHLVLPVDIDESVKAGESPEAYVQRLAIEKARKGFEQTGRKSPALGSDTTVTIDDLILGKPANFEECRSTLKQLSDREHKVLTAVALVDGTKEEVELVVTSVWFGPLSDEDIQAYWDTGEPRDKAGSYGIQGLGGSFVKKINGSYSSVVGLPVYETLELLKKFNIPTWLNTK